MSKEHRTIEELEKVKELMSNLCKKIEFHNKKYYEEDSPIISDFEYDKL